MQNFPRVFLVDEVVSTICFIINQSPSSTIDFKILEEVWLGKLDVFSKLRILIWLSTYIHV